MDSELLINAITEALQNIPEEDKEYFVVLACDATYIGATVEEAIKVAQSGIKQDVDNYESVIFDNYEWDESKHPRDKGKFASKEGATATKEKPKEKKSIGKKLKELPGKALKAAKEGVKETVKAPVTVPKFAVKAGVKASGKVLSGIGKGVISIPENGLEGAAIETVKGVVKGVVSVLSDLKNSKVGKQVNETAGKMATPLEKVGYGKKTAKTLATAGAILAGSPLSITTLGTAAGVIGKWGLTPGLGQVEGGTILIGALAVGAAYKGIKKIVGKILGKKKDNSEGDEMNIDNYDDTEKQNIQKTEFGEIDVNKIDQESADKLQNIDPKGLDEDIDEKKAQENMAKIQRLTDPLSEEDREIMSAIIMEVISYNITDIDEVLKISETAFKEYKNE